MGKSKSDRVDSSVRYRRRERRQVRYKYLRKKERSALLIERKEGA